MGISVFFACFSIFYDFKMWYTVQIFILVLRYSITHQVMWCSLHPHALISQTKLFAIQCILTLSEFCSYYTFCFFVQLRNLIKDKYNKWRKEKQWKSSATKVVYCNLCLRNKTQLAKLQEFKRHSLQILPLCRLKCKRYLIQDFYIYSTN